MEFVDVFIGHGVRLVASLWPVGRSVPHWRTSVFFCYRLKPINSLSRSNRLGNRNRRRRSFSFSVQILPFSCFATAIYDDFVLLIEMVGSTDVDFSIRSEFF